MRVLKRALIIFNLMLGCANNVYATTTDSFIVESTINFSKIILILFALVLVVLILLLGYKLDKNEAQEKGKEDIVEKRNKDSYTNFYNSHSELKKHNDVTNETATFENVYSKLNKKVEDKNDIFEELNKTAVIEKIDLSNIKKSYKG